MTQEVWDVTLIYGWQLWLQSDSCRTYRDIYLYHIYIWFICDSQIYQIYICLVTSCDRCTYKSSRLGSHIKRYMSIKSLWLTDITHKLQWLKICIYTYKDIYTYIDMYLCDSQIAQIYASLYLWLSHIRMSTYYYSSMRDLLYICDSLCICDSQIAQILFACYICDCSHIQMSTYYYSYVCDCRTYKWVHTIIVISVTVAHTNEYILLWLYLWLADLTDIYMPRYICDCRIHKWGHTIMVISVTRRYHRYIYAPLYLWLSHIQMSTTIIVCTCLSTNMYD